MLDLELKWRGLLPYRELKCLHTSLKLIQGRLAVIEEKINEAEKQIQLQEGKVKNACDLESLIVGETILQNFKDERQLKKGRQLKRGRPWDFGRICALRSVRSKRL